MEEKNSKENCIRYTFILFYLFEFSYYIKKGAIHGEIFFIPQIKVTSYLDKDKRNS